MRSALVLDDNLTTRPDRPRVIPLPLPHETTRVAIRRDVTAAGNSAAIINGVVQPTVYLNADCNSKHKQLLSRTHCELGWVDGPSGKPTLYIWDGSAREGKPSCNGSAVNGTMVARGGCSVVPEGAEVDLGTPHLLPVSAGRKKQKIPREFVYKHTAIESSLPVTTASPAAEASPAAKVTPRAAGATLSSSQHAPSTASQSIAGATPSPSQHAPSTASRSLAASPGERKRRLDASPAPSTSRAASRPFESTPRSPVSVAERRQAAREAADVLERFDAEVVAGCEDLFIGARGAASGASLSLTIRNLITSGATRAAPGVVLSQESQESQSQDCGGDDGRAARRYSRIGASTAWFRASLMARTLSALEHEVPPKLSVHDTAALLRSSSTRVQVLISAASLRRRSAIITARASGRLATSSTQSSTSHSLLCRLLLASATMIRLSCTRGSSGRGNPLHTEYATGLIDAESNDDEEDEDEELYGKTGGAALRAIRLASARLSILCNLLLQAPPLTETSEAVFARERCDACLMVFEAAAAAETAIMADGAPGDYDAKLASDAQALAARVLSHAPGAADSVVRRVCVGVSDGDASSRADHPSKISLTPSSSTPSATFECLLRCLGDSHDPAAERLLFAVLKASMPAPRYVSSDSSDCSMQAVFWSRPADHADVLAWGHVCMCASHALQLLVRQHAHPGSLSLLASHRSARAGLQDLCLTVEALHPKLARPAKIQIMLMVAKAWSQAAPPS